MRNANNPSYSEFARVDVSLARAEEIRENVRDGYGSDFATAMVVEAVREWEFENGRRASVGPGYSYVARLTIPDELENYIDENHRRIATEPVVIPVAAESDVVSRDRSVELEVSADELIEIRKRLPLGAAGIALPSRVAERLTAEIGAHKDVAVVHVPAAHDALAEAAGGETRTVYQVVNPEPLPFGPSIVAEADTEEDARAKALRIVNSDPRIPELHIRGVLIRVTDEEYRANVLTVVRLPISETAIIKVAFTKLELRKDTREPDRYVVVFGHDA